MPTILKLVQKPEEILKSKELTKHKKTLAMKITGVKITNSPYIPLLVREGLINNKSFYE